MTNWSQDSMLREIKKCVVLCANCHCIKHYQEEDSLPEMVNAPGVGSTRTGPGGRARRRRRG
jgi:hypothetical protein